AEGGAGPQGGVAAAGIEVPARAAAPGPHSAPHPLLEPGIPCVLGGAARFERCASGRVEVAQGAQDVVQLGFDHVDHRAVAQPGVGAHDEEEVGESGDRGAAQGAHAVPPVVGERSSRAVVDTVGDRHVGDVETGGEDDGVHVVGGAVGGDQGAAPHFLQTGGDYVHVGAAQRRVVVVGQQDAFAPHDVVGGEFRAETRVADSAAQVGRGDDGGGLKQGGVAHEGADHGFAGEVDACPGEFLGGGNGAEQPLFQAGDGTVGARHHPGGGALEDDEPLHQGLDGGDDLDG